MANWILAIVIIAPICLTILAVGIGLLCKRCCQRRSQDELIDNCLLCKRCCQRRSHDELIYNCLLCKRCCQRRSQDELIDNGYSSYVASRNVGYDVESQQRTQRSVNQAVQSQNRGQRNVNYDIESQRTQRSVTYADVTENWEQRNVNYYVESEKKAQRSVNQALQSQNREQRNVNHDVESQRTQRSVNHAVQSYNREQRKVNHDVTSQRRAASDGETELLKRVKEIYFETSTGYPKLDLHNYTLSNAMTVFKIFLKISIAEYKSNHHIRHKRFVLVITGRGLHSLNGIPIIKPAVENYLKTHDYTYNWSNPGMARIDLLPFKERN